MAKTAQEFINQYNNRIVDYDGYAGAQCVDYFKILCAWLGYPVKATGTGWADGYWKYRNSQGYDKYFDFITDKNDLQVGDTLFWAYGSKSCPYSHVGMFTGYANNAKTIGKIFSENQGGNGGFRTINISLDILGAFRPKIWKKAQEVVTPTKTVNATGYAQAFSKSVAKTYECTANLHLRNGAGTKQKSLVVMPKGTKVTCYGYYTLLNGVKWLYVQALVDRTLYTGFCSSTYLK